MHSNLAHRRDNPLTRRWGYSTQLRLFFLPYLAGTIVLVALPALAAVFIAFTRYNAIAAPVWNGLENFQQILHSALIRSGLRNSLIFVLAAVPLRILGALGLALLLQRPGRVFGLYRAAVYLPTIIPEVAYALIWLWIFNPLYGPLNALLAGLGLGGPNWLTEPGSARLAVIIMLSFQLGEGFVVALAGLQNIPRYLYESAEIDGAGSWQKFWGITLPLILPVLLLLAFRDLVVSLQATFTPSFVMTYGGPYYATTFAPLLIYELAFDFFDFGIASATMLALYILLALIVAGVLNLLDGFKVEDVLG
ncbi:MAG: sugar ABC transporter permease [Anaerolineales bacterium]|nr:sugar ABC transporter permease [Anaerolineales bacterium]